jgi:hypothetical protein
MVARAVLSDFGTSQDEIDSHLELLARMGAGEQLKFPQWTFRRTNCFLKDSDCKYKGGSAFWQAPPPLAETFIPAESSDGNPRSASEVDPHGSRIPARQNVCCCAPKD